MAARAKARSLNQWPLLVVVAITAIALIVVARGHWRWGSGLFGAALCLGGLARLVLPRRMAGLLQVRGRAFDVTVLLGAGIAIIVLALAVPPG
ncbi:hypothetical protein CGZ94_10890 [Enemella evansiae]|uniref:DUF3017 domain-containing protein n=2 Tax=Enemella evansiae TaxID=2016499 RepID=A0A255GCS6_9ACTN|nr:hypothetical protein CGZ95_18020 [Enemella evansiae]OYO00366.1 hypothetical protein CGZ96_05170 [Enemella evansiae]OYO04316.1 hypothetical protein CGZ97_09790 [Enemella evansiae]OYO10227.1 hypothetical protein CGZ98_13670 [Enemella evansiae]OYO10448.1 hypothetical protein BI335_17335 [Enemella evansiae]